jgi:hypothetical protein
MPIAPRIKSTIAALAIHITGISLFSVFGSFWFVIATSLFGSATQPVCAGHKRGIQAVCQPFNIYPIAAVARVEAPSLTRALSR